MAKTKTAPTDLIPPSTDHQSPQGSKGTGPETSVSTEPDTTTKKTTETKSAKFTRLATARTNAALKALVNIRRLFNAAQYTWTEDQSNKVVTAIEDALHQIAAAAAGKRTFSAGFTL